MEVTCHNEEFGFFVNGGRRIIFLFSPSSQAASVATLPSALLVERFSLGASWVFSMQ